MFRTCCLSAFDIRPVPARLYRSGLGAIRVLIFGGNLGFKCLRNVGRPPTVSVVPLTEAGFGMEDLLLAFVTLAASLYIFSHLADAGTDAFVIVTFLASLPVVGYLAYERGRSHWRWTCVAVIIGPLAVPMLYFVAAISTFRKMINDRRP
jgi:hypothetical protein